MTTTTRFVLAVLIALPLGGCGLLDEFAEDDAQICRSSGSSSPHVRCSRESTPREVRKPGDPHTLPNVAL